MSITLLDRPSGTGAEAGTTDGGVVARRAVTRWAWRLFIREWRQQLLVLALIVVAVAATVLAAAVSLDGRAPVAGTFGNAQDLVTFSFSGPKAPASTSKMASEITSLEHRFGKVDVIEDQTLQIPGSVDTYELRAQDPHGAYGAPMLSLVFGHYPNGSGQVAMTSQLATDFHLRVGDHWHEGGTSRQLVGIVSNPQSLLDEFALVAPGQVSSPTQVTVLFDAGAVNPSTIGANVQTRSSFGSNQNNVINPETISIAGLTIGMLLIALVAVGGFTVLAQRRLRSLGMLGSLGATDRNVGLVVRANGVVTGVVGAVVGLVLAFVLWLAYRPHLESSSHHVVGVWAIPWLVVVLAVVLAIVATYFAASRPAKAMSRVPIVQALSGRPAPPRKIHRSAVPGVVFFVVAFILLGISGGSNNRGGGGGGGAMPFLILGLVCLIPGVILLSPFFLTVLSRIGRRTPAAVRLALRDLARYRARSGSALSAISVGVLIAVIVAIVAAARYGNYLDYAGPNLASNQIIVYTPNNGPAAPICGPSAGGGAGCSTTSPSLTSLDKTAHAIGSAIGAKAVVELYTTSAGLDYAYAGNGRNWSGPVYAGTPSLLGAFGIDPSEMNPKADVLTMRPGISTLSGMQLTWQTGSSKSTLITPGQGAPGGGQGQVPNGSGSNNGGCRPANGCLANPVIQQINALPSGTSAPNTVITEHALKQFGLEDQLSTTGWLIQTANPITAAQLNNAQGAAGAASMTIESKNDEPSSAEVIDWATVFGIALALAILAMSVGLIRSETSGDLRTLASTGASSFTRRTLTATTAGALGLLGGLLGTLAGYIGVIGWIRTNSLNGGISALGNIPVVNLLVIVLGMPLLAAIVGWVFAGKEQPAMAHQPIE